MLDIEWLSKYIGMLVLEVSSTMAKHSKEKEAWAKEKATLEAQIIKLNKDLMIKGSGTIGLENKDG